MLGLLVFALRALGRRKARAVALGGGLAFAVALVSAVLFLSDALRGESEAARDALPDLVVSRLRGGRPALISLQDAQKITGIDSVRAVTPRVWGYVFVPALQANVVVMGTREGQPPLEAVKGALAEGRDLHPGAHEMVAGARIARFLGVVVGDELGLPSPNPKAPSLKLVGTFSSSVDLFTNDVIVTSDADARAILGLAADECTDFVVDLANPEEAGVVAKTVTTRLPDARVVDKKLLARAHTLAFGRRSGIVLAASFPVFLALLVLAWDRLSGVGDSERREIAVLKAVGWSTGDVLGAKLSESLLVGVFATAAGLALGYAWVFLAGAPLFRPALAGFGVLYPEASLTPQVDVAQLLGITLAVLGPFVALSIVPAWRAAQIDPMDAMRDD